ncbi:hypothetical protein OG625_11855 [Streptomyces sp. NBC_01351]|nr:hypothetical protein [Streptomyces sp. NBC_01351]
MPFGETNPAMVRVLARADTRAVREAEIPETPREVVRRGWSG